MDMKLFVRKLGQGEPLVLLHGWGFDHRVMLPLAEALSHTYEVHLIDLPGFGRSKIAMDTIEFEKVVQCIKASIPQNAYIAGWSLGGLIALNLASHARKISLLASSPYFLGAENWPGITLRFFESFRQNFAKNPAKSLNQFASWQGYFIDPIIIPEGAHQHWQQWLHWMAHTDLRKETYPCKIQIVLGQKDQLLPENLAASLAKFWPAAEIHLLADQGHFMFGQKSELIADLMKQFFKD